MATKSLMELTDELLAAAEKETVRQAGMTADEIHQERVEGERRDGAVRVEDLMKLPPQDRKTAISNARMIIAPRSGPYAGKVGACEYVDKCMQSDDTSNQQTSDATSLVSTATEFQLSAMQKALHQAMADLAATPASPLPPVTDEEVDRIVKEMRSSALSIDNLLTMTRKEAKEALANDTSGMIIKSRTNKQFFGTRGLEAYLKWLNDPKNDEPEGEDAAQAVLDKMMTDTVKQRKVKQRNGNKKS